MEGVEVLTAKVPEAYSVTEKLVHECISARAVEALRDIVKCSDFAELPGLSFVHAAVDEGLPEAVKVLVHAGVPHEHQHESDMLLGPPLYAAVLYGEDECARVLIDSGSDVNARNGLGEPVLSRAVREKNVAMVEVLIKAGADVNAKDPDGLGAVWWAAAKGSTECIVKLHGAGADLEGTDNMGYLPLNAAVFRGRASTAAKMVQLGCDVNKADPDGTAPLMKAVAGTVRCENDMVKTLLRLGAQVNQRDWRGMTAFHQAAASSACIDLLYHAGADVELIDNKGWNAAHHAAYAGSDESLQHVMVLGTSTFEKAIDGTTPRGVAEGELKKVKASEGHIDDDFECAEATKSIQSCLDILSDKEVMLRMWENSRVGMRCMMMLARRASLSSRLITVIENRQRRIYDDLGELHVLPTDILHYIAELYSPGPPRDRSFVFA